MNIHGITGMLVEIKTMKVPSGMMTKFTVLNVETYFTKTGEEKVSQTPFDIICWGRLSQHVEHWETGSFVEVWGKEQLRKWTTNGVEKWHREIVADGATVKFRPHEIGGVAPAEKPAEKDEMPPYFSEKEGDRA